jgi:hypothetical protein
MKKVILLLMLVVMTASSNCLNARPVYGWCGYYYFELPDDATKEEIRIVNDYLDLLCDIDEEEVQEEQEP